MNVGDFEMCNETRDLFTSRNAKDFNKKLVNRII